MKKFIPCRRMGRVAALIFALLIVPALTIVVQAADKQPDGTVTVEQFQVAFIASAQFGDGELKFQGKTYPFKISGLGVGGIGISTIDADGYVYDLKDVADFSGVYGQARTGVTFGTVGKGQLWLENTNGVYLHLKAKREGLALAIGADGMVIQMDNWPPPITSVSASSIA